MLLTWQYRIKDSNSRKALRALSSCVNLVWNYVNELNRKAFTNFKQGGSGKFLTAFDINNLLSGSSRELGLHSQTLQHISETYVSCRTTNKKSYLRWRSSKRSLGWIPFKASGFKWSEDQVTYQGKIYRIYKSRSLPDDAKIKTGSFSQDTQGRWYVNITFETAARAQHEHPATSVGIDLGVSEALTLSNGLKFSRPGATKLYENKLATAQRANKKRQVSKIQAKIKNTRRDYYHKLTTQITLQFATIFIGNVKSQDIIDKQLKPLTKGVYDASWFLVKNLLEYKAIGLGGLYLEVSEAWTTQDCSSCGARCGPRGTDDLNIREWTCSTCNATHCRDTNAAINILRIGHDTLAFKAKALNVGNPLH